MTDAHRIECGDAIELLATLGKGDASVVITDPPYSPHVHDNARTGGGSDYGVPVDLKFDSLDPRVRARCAREFARVTRRWVLCFTDLEGIAGWIADLRIAGLEYIRTCIWTKPGASPQFTGDRPASHAEAIVVAHAQRSGEPMKKRWNGGGRSNVFSHPPVRLQRCHKTQKPIRLMRQLVELFSNSGELVLDPFAGSGTTGVACKQLGRRFLGCERDSAVAGLARSRLRRTRADLPFERETP